MRYLGEDLEVYKKIYEIKTRDDPKSWAALTNVFKVLTETPLDTLEATLAPIFNIDGALRFLALEIALVNTDGYWTRASDYNIYLDEQGRIHILPHDVNEAFEEGAGPGRGRGGPPALPGSAPAAVGQPAAAPPAGGPSGLPPFPATFGRAARSRSAHRHRRCDASRSGRGCSRCRPFERATLPMSRRSPRSGWTGILSSRSSASTKT